MKQLLIAPLIFTTLLGLTACGEVKNEMVNDINLTKEAVPSGGIIQKVDITDEYTGSKITNGKQNSATGAENASVTTIWTESFSDTQIQDILAKIEENTKKQQETEKNTTGTLIQGDFKAVYIAPKDYWKDFDKIMVTIPGKTYELPGVYGKSEMEKYTDTIKKWGCKIPDGRTGVLFNGNRYEEPSNWDCLMMKEFAHFVGFSPSGYYLQYTISGYESAHSKLIDIKTGEVVIETPFSMSTSFWTTDKKQFIYGAGNGMGNWPGLYITKKWNFPEIITIQDTDEVMGWYVDESYIYTSSWNKLKIYSLTTLKEVFSKEIQK